MMIRRVGGVGTRCEGCPGETMVRAVRHRPVISPDDLSSGVYTSRRAARWATGHGGVLSRSEKRRRSGGGERFRCPT